MPTFADQFDDKRQHESIVLPDHVDGFYELMNHADVFKKFDINNIENDLLVFLSEKPKINTIYNSFTKLEQKALIQKIKTNKKLALSISPHQAHQYREEPDKGAFSKLSAGVGQLFTKTLGDQTVKEFDAPISPYGGKKHKKRKHRKSRKSRKHRKSRKSGKKRKSKRR